MTRAVLVVLGVLVPACQAGVGGDYPPRPGGGGPIAIGGGSGGRDGGVGDGGRGDTGVLISGRVCLLADMRQWTRCADTKAGGLKVSLGPASAPNEATTMTSDDGGFTIAAPLGAGFTWHVTGAQLTTSVMSLGTENTIPALTDLSYVELLESNSGLMQDEQHGSVVIRVVSGVSPVAGVVAAPSPPADSLTYYDADNNPTVWSTTATGSAGVVWLPSVTLPGPVTLALSTIDGKTAIAAATVESQAITFVTQSVP